MKLDDVLFYCTRCDIDDLSNNEWSLGCSNCMTVKDVIRAVLIAIVATIIILLVLA